MFKQFPSDGQNSLEDLKIELTLSNLCPIRWYSIRCYLLRVKSCCNDLYVLILLSYNFDEPVCEVHNSFFVFLEDSLQIYHEQLLCKTTSVMCNEKS